MNPKASERPRATDRSEADWLDVVHRKVDGLRFGSVQIIVHEGRVTQIESLEKTRFQSQTREESAD
jgi:hypothetical protein